MPYTVLISGANRGLGRGLSEVYLAKPDHTVIAFIRDPKSPSSLSLLETPKGNGSKLIVIKCDATIESDPFDAVSELEKSVDHLDLVIANAGISRVFPAVKDVKIADLQAHLEPNVFGVIMLFQATRPLLLNAKQPIFSTMGSSAGRIESLAPIPNAAYAPTKAAVHWLTKRMDAEEPQITAFVMDPGWVDTEMGTAGAIALGFGKAFQTLEEVIPGMEKVFAAVTKETHGGKLINWEGKTLSW